jgi:asparagine synthase (glutamine-hydrolysing)
VCGIAGVVDLMGTRPVPDGLIERMTASLAHRGPDGEGFLRRPGLALGSRRLAIVGLEDGGQPIANEDGTVWTVFNGELFDYPEERAALEARSHRFRTHTDTELVPHLWEEHREALPERLRGQFALALWDERGRRLLLARDRFGICPLYWSRQGDWLLFASEVRALLASGMVAARPDPRGIDQAFHFLALPGPTTCFAGVQLLLPGYCMSVSVGGTSGETSPRPYWQMDFPDRGQEVRPARPAALVEEFESVLSAAVARRLRADVPVVSYLSAGVDSGTVVALAARALGGPIPTFTIRVPHPRLDETAGAAVTARHVGGEAMRVELGPDAVTRNYPRLIAATEMPVLDPSSVGLLLQAEAVHRRGYKVALTGEGADEWLAGYSWFKVERLIELADTLPKLGSWARGAYFRWLAGAEALRQQHTEHEACGGRMAFSHVFDLIALARGWFYSPAMRAELRGHDPYAALEPDLGRARRWHPLHRGLYWGARVQLAGHLLCLKGDRVAMHSSVETRYPFLDERVFDFLAPLHPDWKLRGWRDKWLLRKLAERHLPREVAWRPKGRFRTPLDSFFRPDAPPYVAQLLSEESLRRTGYFDPQAVRVWRARVRRLPAHSLLRTAAELGLVGVVATQLWHQRFIDPTLADV